MQILIVNQKEVLELLPMAECMEVMVGTLAALARGQAILPLRPVMWLPEKIGALAMMPAYLDMQLSSAESPFISSKDIRTPLSGPVILGTKVITYMPGNGGTEYDTHQGVVLLFEKQHGQLLTMIDATSITSIRTAAVSSVATKWLACQDAGDLAILGTGTQARSHLEAMLLARSIRRVRVWSRNPEHVLAFSRRESNRHHIQVEASPSARAAVEGADLICTTTSAVDPVLFGEWLAPGAHINAVGSSVAHARELDTAAVGKSRLFVDRRESALNEAGDFLFPKKEGVINDDHILGEIGEVMIGKVQGRRSPNEITLFKSLGLAIEDLATAQYIYSQALKKGAGIQVEFGGRRNESA